MSNRLIRPIENKDQAQALAVFLVKERQRHQRDIDQIEGDLAMLADRWGLEIPGSVEDCWWEP